MKVYGAASLFFLFFKNMVIQASASVHLWLTSV